MKIAVYVLSLMVVVGISQGLPRRDRESNLFKIMFRQSDHSLLKLIRLPNGGRDAYYSMLWNFNEIDTNGDNELRLKELLSRCREVFPQNFALDPFTAKALMKVGIIFIDADNNGGLSFDELLEYDGREDISAFQVRNLFKVFDESQDRKLDNEELAAIFGPKQARVTMLDVDKNGDGVITLAEFRDMIQDS